MKERVCMSKRCPLRRQHRKTKELYCLAGWNAEGYFMQKVVAVKEKQCISRRVEAKRAEKEAKAQKEDADVNKKRGIDL